jgi:hypothetical protein
MRSIILMLTLIILGQAAYCQYTYTIKADSVKITNCDSAELILENHTQGVKGFLYNKGNGRTEFRNGSVKLTDSTYLIGGDTLKIPLGFGSADNGLSVVDGVVQLGNDPVGAPGGAATLHGYTEIDLNSNRLDFADYSNPIAPSDVGMFRNYLFIAAPGGSVDDGTEATLEFEDDVAFTICDMMYGNNVLDLNAINQGSALHANWDFENNTAAISDSDYVSVNDFFHISNHLTGADNKTTMELESRWNTSGAPTAFKITIEDEGSDATSLLMDLNVNGSSKLSLSKSGNLITAGAIKTADPSSGAGVWDLGKIHSSSITADLTKYVEVKIDGVVYKLVTAN